MSELREVEAACSAEKMTLVLHPAVRKALTGLEDEFAIRAVAFIRGEAPKAYYLPLFGGGDVKLVFSLRYSAGEYLILRVDAAHSDGLPRVREAVRRSEASK